MKKFIYKLFNINKIIGFFLCVISTFLLIYVFSLHLEETLIAYISYLLSTYSLILFIIWFIKACHFSNDFIKKTKIYTLYKNSEHMFLKLSLTFSSVFNLVYSILKLYAGIYCNSFWFITFSIYYLILCVMKFLLLKDTNKFDNDIKNEYKKLKNTGIILLSLNFILFGIIILIVRDNYYFSNSAYLIYLLALYDFYITISAFINVFKYRKNKSPIITASKCINLTVAMISILSLESYMIYTFGNNDSDFRITMVSLTGFFIFLINSIMSGIMIYKSKSMV